MYEVSHIMEDICQTEQDEMRVIPFHVFHKHIIPSQITLVI